MRNTLVFSLFLAWLSMTISGCDQPTKPTLFRMVPASESGVDFNNEIKESDTFNILTYEYIYNGGGVGVADFNNDGRKDLFFAGNLVSNKLYLNKGNFGFQDVTETASVNIPGRWNSGVAVVDINNDGWMDVYVTATMRPDSIDRGNMLFVNQGLNKEGIPTFLEQAGSYGIADNGYGVMAAFFDYDHDNDLDLYVLINQRMSNVPSNYRPRINDGTAANNDRLYRNNGNSTFTDVTMEAGIVHEGFGLGIAISDFNKDGLPDIYVSNDYISNDIMYINNGNGTYTNKIAEYIGHQSQFSMGSDVADINNDLQPDIVTVDMLPETNARKKTTIGNKSYSVYLNNEQFGYEYQYVRNMIHLNNGLDKGIHFSEIGQLSGVHQTEWSWAPLFVDADNDGFKDLIITNGFPKDITDKDFSNYRADIGNLASPGFLNDSIPVVKIPNYAFKNGSNLVFEDVTDSWGLGAKSFSNGAAFVDLDNDGDLDYVTNNINDPAFIFENTLNKSGQPAKTNWIDITLTGIAANRNAIGSKVVAYTSTGMQYYEVFPYRGFLSSVDPGVHFGIGASASIDSVSVTWPDGKHQVITAPGINKELKVAYSEADQQEVASPASKRMLEDITVSSGLQFQHADVDNIDFNQQRTLPHKFSQSGPGLSVGDVNNDGLEDLVIGGSTEHEFSIFLQQKNGIFKPQRKGDASPVTSKREEDEGMLLFDADNDGDLDLYVVSGGFEGETPENYNDRLYLNDGNGNFKINVSALEPGTSSGSCVRASDIDGDGDLDLFVGGRVIPSAYPQAPESYILINEKGKFTNKTKEVAAGLERVGMVTDALWSDFDNDGKTDLIVVGEFMPVTFFRNDGRNLSALKATGIDSLSGWWNSITGADFDNDGDIDYVAGNLGLNNNFQVKREYPLKVYAKDFDGNGSIDPVLACYMRVSMDGPEKKLFPVHFWDELNTQSPKFRRKFSRYKQFAKASMDVLFTPEELNGAMILEANEMASSYIENEGNGKFSMTSLPVQAQVAPVNGIVATDVDGDGNVDAIIIGNDYGNEVFAGRYDALNGLVLKGNGKGGFEAVGAGSSGLNVPGDAKALVRINNGTREVFVASRNKGTLLAFSVDKTGDKVYQPVPGDVWAELIFADGMKQKVEFYWGSGFLSQSGRAMRVPKGVSSFTVHDSKGNAKTVANQ